MLCIGVMSGTSCDGVDLALVDFASATRTVATTHQPYPDDLRNDLLNVIGGGSLPISVISRLETSLSTFYAESINRFLQQQHLVAREVAAIGLHGQTVYHQPAPPLANTIQWGNPAVVCALTGITTINQFRQLDVALGGQGAPLAPAFHRQLLRQARQPAAIINLGGIANLSTNINGQLIGFDTGPANCLMDEWCQAHRGQPHDDCGQWAASGQVVPELLEGLLQDAYFHQAYPKSTGREYFHLNWLKGHLGDTTHRPEDVQRTLLALTAQSIAMGLQQSHSRPEAVYLCGGGVHNATLVAELEKCLSAQVMTTAALGVDPDYVEATLMAWLAHRRVLQQTLDLRSVTGVHETSLYGVITSAK